MHSSFKFSHLNEESSHDDQGCHSDVESVRGHVLWEGKRQEANRNQHDARQKCGEEVSPE